tara:strand:+ start:651 stop:1223 length:573 start_codon:yes stop_codon:yes gene_type:complete
MQSINNLDNDELLKSLPWFQNKVNVLNNEEKEEEITSLAKNILEKIEDIFKGRRFDEEAIDKYLINGKGNAQISQEEFINLAILKYKQFTGKGVYNLEELCSDIQRKKDVSNFEIATGRGKTLELIKSNWNDKHREFYPKTPDTKLKPQNILENTRVRDEVRNFLKKGGKRKYTKTKKTRKEKTRKKKSQ